MDSESEIGKTESLHREFRERIGYAAIDGDGNRVGFVDIVVEDEVGRSVFLGIRTGVVGFSRMHLVPAYLADQGQESHHVKLPFGRKILEKAPAIDGDFQWNGKMEAAVYAFYRAHGFEAPHLEAPLRV
jgi:hypothetical protein